MRWLTADRILLLQRVLSTHFRLVVISVMSFRSNLAQKCNVHCSMVFYTFDICVHRLLGTPPLWIEWIKFDKDNGTCATSIALFVFYQSILIQSFDAFYVSSLFCRRSSTRCYCLFSHLADDLIKMMNNLNCFGPVEMSHKVHSHSSILLSFENQF